MDRAQNKPTIHRLLTLCIAGLGIVYFGAASLVFAQSGQTEVTKTVPSTPAPAQPAPGPAAVAPQPQPSAQATPVSPIGQGANWQASVSPQANAEPVATDDLAVVTKVNTYFNTMTNIQGTFIQTDPDTKQKRGRFYFERPGKVRFDYGSPSKLKIISDGKQLAIEDHDLQTTDRYPLELTPFRLILSEKVDLLTDAKIVSVEQGADTIVLTVEDKKGDAGGRIRLFFNAADTSLKEWIITDPQGLDTRIQLTNIEQNKQIASNLFEFSKNLGFKNN